MKNLWKRGTVFVVLAGLAVLASGCDLLPFTATIEVRNHTLTSVVEVNIVPRNSASWGQNQLRDPIGQGESASFTVPAGAYDLRAIDSLGRVATRFDVRLRPDDEEVWTLTELKDVEEGPDGALD